MAAFLIAFAKIKDASRLQEYSAAAGPTLIAAGGSIVARGKLATTLAGSLSADSCLIVKFPSADAARAWYESPAYQALIPLRDQVMSPNFVVLEEPS